MKPGHRVLLVVGFAFITWISSLPGAQAELRLTKESSEDETPVVGDLEAILVHPANVRELIDESRVVTLDDRRISSLTTSRRPPRRRPQRRLPPVYRRRPPVFSLYAGESAAQLHAGSPRTRKFSTLERALAAAGNVELELVYFYDETVLDQLSANDPGILQNLFRSGVAMGIRVTNGERLQEVLGFAELETGGMAHPYFASGDEEIIFFHRSKFDGVARNLSVARSSVQRFSDVYTKALSWIGDNNEEALAGFSATRDLGNQASRLVTTAGASNDSAWQTCWNYTYTGQAVSSDGLDRLGDWAITLATAKCDDCNGGDLSSGIFYSSLFDYYLVSVRAEMTPDNFSCDSGGTSGDCGPYNVLMTVDIVNDSGESRIEFSPVSSTGGGVVSTVGTGVATSGGLSAETSTSVLETDVTVITTAGSTSDDITSELTFLQAELAEWWTQVEPAAAAQGTMGFPVLGTWEVEKGAGFTFAPSVLLQWEDDSWGTDILTNYTRQFFSYNYAPGNLLVSSGTTCGNIEGSCGAPGGFCSTPTFDECQGLNETSVPSGDAVGAEAACTDLCAGVGNQVGEGCCWTGDECLCDADFCTCVDNGGGDVTCELTNS